MEITCTRCHQTIQTDACFCPSCGLPQLTYSDENGNELSKASLTAAPVRDASTVNWRVAMRSSAMLAVPAGVLCALPQVSILGIFLMGAAAAWAVLLYVRNQQAPWITLGAGARIGLVTGLFGGWTAAAASGVALFAMRFVFHHGDLFDNFWQEVVAQESSQQWASMGVNAQTIALARAWLLSPEGRAAWVLCALIMLASGLLLFATAGGAIGARILVRRRPRL